MLQAPSNSETGLRTLVNIALDLQIIICTLLHPYDILALRKTCKALQLVTRRRVVWVAALRRVCLDNSLFLPSFPIVDMSDAELEHAAMAPRRWIELCTAFKEQHPNDSGAILRPRTTRIIEDSLAAADHFGHFIVPGGRYLVSWARSGIFIWDLGYTSSADFKLIASVGPEGGPEGKYYSCMVQATPDGTSLIILSSHLCKQCSIYEIYPQSETPRLNRIAHLDSYPYLPECPWVCLLPDRMVWDTCHQGSMVFSIWDYRVNYSISFAADVDIDKLENDYEVIATKTAIIVPCGEGILVWAIPPLLPQPPEFFDHNPTPIPALFRIAYPHDIVFPSVFVAPQTMSHWYDGSSQPLYFDVLCYNSGLHVFEIIVKPDLFDTSLHNINIQSPPDDFDDVALQRYSICEDTLVACCETLYSSEQIEVYAWSRFPTSISHGGSAAKVLLPRTASGYKFSLCPTSGRYVHLDHDICGIVVVDLF